MTEIFGFVARSVQSDGIKPNGVSFQKTDISVSRRNRAEFGRIHRSGLQQELAYNDALQILKAPDLSYVHGTECIVDVNPTAGHMYVIQRRNADEPLSSFLRDRIQWTYDGTTIHPKPTNPTVIQTNYSNMESGLQHVLYHQPAKTSFMDALLLRKSRCKKPDLS